MTADGMFAFDEAEHGRRLAAIRERMTARGIDVLVTHLPANMCYASGFDTIGIFEYACLIIPLDRRPTLVVRTLEENTARTRVRSAEIVLYMDTDDPVRVAAGAIGALGPQARVGLERDVPNLTPARYAAFVRAIGEGRVVDGSGVIEPVRLLKSAPEIACMRASAAATDASMSAGLAAIAEGRSENDVAAAVYAGAIHAGSEWPSNPPAVLSGPRTALAHSTWSGRRLERGDPVYLVTSACINRYTTAIFRAATVGPATDEQRRMAETVARGLEAAQAAMRPGAVGHDVDAACHRAFERAGFGAYHRHRTGYSMGISFPPHVGEVTVGTLRSGSDLVLAPGMVFHVCPALFIPGVIGIGISETVLVTATGSEFLGSLPRRIVEVGN